MQNAMHAAHKHNAWSDLFRLFCITHTHIYIYIYAYIVIGVASDDLWLNSQPAHLSSGLLEPVSLRNSMPGKWLDPGDMSHVDSSAREHRCASGQNELNHIP